MILLDGAALAKKLYLERQSKTQPFAGLSVILVGQDPSSRIYVERKRKACVANGIQSQIHLLPDHTTQEELHTLIHQLNLDPKVTGILLQLPLPQHLDKFQAVSHMDPTKDVDGLHPRNLGYLTQGIQAPHAIWPCTPLGCIRLVDSIFYELRGKHAVVVGSSFLVGKPMATMLTLRDATVTLCHKYTENLEWHVRSADLLVVAVGIPHLIPGNWVKEGAVVLDIGVNRLPDGSIVGDVEFEVAKNKAFAITPVPGGVGPMTVAMLMENTLRAAHPLINRPIVGLSEEVTYGRDDRVRTLPREEKRATDT